MAKRTNQRSTLSAVEIAAMRDAAVEALDAEISALETRLREARAERAALGGGKRGPSQAKAGDDSITGQVLTFLAANGGEHRTRDIAAGIGAEGKNLSTMLTQLAERGQVVKVRHGVYSGA